MRLLGTPDEAPSAAWTQQVTGTAWMDVLLREHDLPVSGDVALTSVTFPPGVRTHGHHHAGGQLLLVLAGRGWVGSREDGRLDVTAGDIVWTPPGQVHWHGATDSTTLTHLAVTLGSTEWAEVTEVTDITQATA
jgi:quercetin dioxygenase-like cupin family protein